MKRARVKNPAGCGAGRGSPPQHGCRNRGPCGGIYQKRNAGAGKPFYAYIPFSLVHVPTLPNLEFAGRTGNGDWADCLAEMDHGTGQILDAIRAAGIENDTLVVFASDNGPEATHPWEGDKWTVARYLLHGDGGLTACTVHPSLAGKSAGGACQQRNRSHR